MLIIFKLLYYAFISFFFFLKGITNGTSLIILAHSILILCGFYCVASYFTIPDVSLNVQQVPGSFVAC